MSIRIGINGFGRMGRLALRAGWDKPDLEFAHINEVSGGPSTAAHLLTFDSVHGRWHRRVARSTVASTSTATRISFQDHSTPGAVPWSSKDVDVVLECSGRFRTKETLEEYLAVGVKTVIVAAPVKTGR